MRAITKRSVAFAAAGAAAAAAVVFSAGAASADVTGGTISITVNDSYISMLASHGVAIVPQHAASVVCNNNGTVTITFTVTGGLGNLNNFAGTVDASGSLLGFSINHGLHTTTLGTLNYNVLSESFDGTPTGGSDTQLVDLGGNITLSVTPDATNPALTDDAFGSDQLTIDPAGAALLNSALHTSAFVAGANIGSFSAAWTVQ